MELLERLERELVFANKAVKDENGNEVNFDGLLTLLAAANSDNVIDKKGAAFSFDDLDDDAENLVTTGKQPSVDGYVCLMSPHVSKGLNQQYAARNVVRNNKDGAIDMSITPGFKVPKYETQFGDFTFDHSILLQEVENGSPVTAAVSGAPSSPAITTQPVAATDATVHIPAGTYYYTVAAVNDSGESLGTTCTAVAVIDGQKVTTVVTREDDATCYRIYRGTKSDASDAKWIAKVPQPASGNLTFVDKGEWLPVNAAGKQSDGLVIEVKPDRRDITIAQMSPLIKMALPQVGTTFPFLLLLYIVAVIKAPERIRIYKNCGPYTAP